MSASPTLGMKKQIATIDTWKQNHVESDTGRSMQQTTQQKAQYCVLSVAKWVKWSWSFTLHKGRVENYALTETTALAEAALLWAKQHAMCNRSSAGESKFSNACTQCKWDNRL